MMILFIRSAEEVARYEAGYKFYEISRFAVRPTAMVFFPLCASLVASNEWAGFRSVARKLLLAAAAAGTIVRVLFLGLPSRYVSYGSSFLAQGMNLEGRVA